MHVLAILSLCFLSVVPALALDEWIDIPGRDGLTLKALVMKPEGAGPFPAIVALHGCGGLNARDGKPTARHRDWGQRLIAAGYIVVFPESFLSRGLGPQCNVRDRTIFPRDRTKDAFAAAEWLAGQAEVNAKKLGLLGWSHGGTTALSASRTIRRPMKGVEFRQVVAFYPGCRAFANEDFRTRIPVTIFHGLADDWTPPEPCQALPNVTFIGYPGAFHDFDYPNLKIQQRKAALSRRPDGMVTIGTDAAAREDALAKAFALFGRM
ncbi:COG0412 Dienelactone hydrolase and related enzymes [Rhabdaerophilaceae bacterium]